jgi:ring-1,2-phenylacetyl-CoA epoxidase subunit PaaD
MVALGDIWNVLRTVDDPEMPINIVDLGMVEKVSVDAAPQPHITLDLLPTFVGCPALRVIEEEIRKRLGKIAEGSAIEIHFQFHPPWTVDRINKAGREALKKVGVTVPGPGQTDLAEPVHPSCPFCGSSRVRMESPFGPTRCRMIYHCESCRNPFEHLKRVGIESTLLTLNTKEASGDPSTLRAPSKNIE